MQTLKIRMTCQQLCSPGFDNPEEIVEWMGAIQAQDYEMVKWAVGIRLKSGSLKKVEEALQKGKIIRTHVMRPTWHLVPAADLKWMLKLSYPRIKRAYQSYAKSYGVDGSLWSQCNDIILKALEGNRHLTKQEIGEEIKKAGVLLDANMITLFLTYSEIEGIICSGADNGKKITYALIHERIDCHRDLDKEESLAELAKRFFRSHSPASLNDFSWWSGLTVKEAKEAMGLIESELTEEKFKNEKLFIHTCWDKSLKKTDAFHFLPSYDEYLISYKDRRHVLDPLHNSKAFNKNGIFFPVILHNGKITGNWTKKKVKDEIHFTTSFFEEDIQINPSLIEKAKETYIKFHL